MDDLSIATTPENQLPLATQGTITHVRVLATDNSENVPIEDFAQRFNAELNNAITETQAAAVTAVEASVEAVEAMDLVLANTDILGGIAYSAAAPTPAKSGKYYFTTGGSCTWITGGAVTVAVGDTVVVVYTAPTYTYTHVANTEAYEVASELQAVFPASKYVKRVLADGGTIASKQKTVETSQAVLDLLASAKFLWDGSMGTKRRVSGINTYASKVYSLDATDNDGVQATEGSQPYLGGLIAPNELAKLKNLAKASNFNFGVSGLPSYGAADKFTLNFIVKLNSKQIGAIISNTDTYKIIYLYDRTLEIRLGGDIIYINNAYAYDDLSKTLIYSLAYNGNGALSIWKNGEIISSVSVNPSSVEFSNIIGVDGLNRSIEGEMYHISLLSNALNSTEISNLHTYLRTLHPEIEAVPVGSLMVATSNFEGTVDADGVAIPEVTDNAAWAALTTPAWCYYNNDPALGAVYGKLYNWWCTQLKAPAGWHWATDTDFAEIAEVYGGNTVAGKALKAVWGGFANEFADNRSGVSLIGDGQRAQNGDFYSIEEASCVWTSKNANPPTAMRVLSTNTTLLIASFEINRGMPLRAIRNEPYGNDNEERIAVTTSNIASTPLSIPIPHGYSVTAINVETTTSVTAIEAKLADFNDNVLETLITGKACNATQKVFRVTADHTVLKNKGSVNITAAGNTGTMTVRLQLVKTTKS